ncbi:uncharacterized protein [Miscanthus floridulus]|uniref:uncharacterized protein isoform X1 n=1 Tax=Miscanthus floridulus TaxID=154761 RepID=UPI00345AA671
MLQSYDFHCDRYLLRLLVFQQLRICLLSEDSVLMNLVKHQVLENTRDACIFSLPSMVRFLLVLAWVVIQGIELVEDVQGVSINHSTLLSTDNWKHANQQYFKCLGLH